MASLSFIDGDWSEFPVIGARYKYYLSPVADSAQPYDLQAHLGRNSWLKVDVNALNFNPNLAGKFYFSERWSVEADFSYQSDDSEYSSTDQNGQLRKTKYQEDELLSDIAINFAFNEQLTFGVGIHNFSEVSEYSDIIDDYVNSKDSHTHSDTFVALKARYTNVIAGKGLDVSSSISYNKDQNTAKVSATFYTAKDNAFLAGIVFTDFTDQDDNDTDGLFAFSLGHHYWFSQNTAIKYGVSWIKSDDNYVLLDLNGTWRF